MLVCAFVQKDWLGTSEKTLWTSRLAVKAVCAQGPASSPMRVGTHFVLGGDLT